MTYPENTQTVADLLTMPQERRDQYWIERFLAAVPDAPLQILDPQMQLGPDGYPYFQLAIPSAGNVAFCTLTQALDHCLDRGVGVVIFKSPGRADEPGWVFNYAQLFSYSLFGNFQGDPSQPPAPVEQPDGHGRSVLLAAPSESFLPPRVRRAMASFFRNVFGIENPKMIMVVEPGRHPSNALMFDLSAQNFGGDEEKYDRALNALHWYLPMNYCAVLRKPADWSNESFVPLLADRAGETRAP